LFALQGSSRVRQILEGFGVHFSFDILGENVFELVLIFILIRIDDLSFFLDSNNSTIFEVGRIVVFGRNLGFCQIMCVRVVKKQFTPLVL
jgi:hypothetical protein